MKVKLTDKYSHVAKRGKVVDLAEALAVALCADGCAEPVDDAPETAAVEAPETAMKPAPKKRKAAPKKRRGGS